jgi:hypothetical protein
MAGREHAAITARQSGEASRDRLGNESIVIDLGDGFLAQRYGRPSADWHAGRKREAMPFATHIGSRRAVPWGILAFDRHPRIG